jgi:hypothetical protein
MPLMKFSKVGSDYLIHEKIDVSNFELSGTDEQVIEDLDGRYPKDSFALQFIKTHRHILNKESLQGLGENFCIRGTLAESLEQAKSEIKAIEVLIKVFGADSQILQWGNYVELKRLATPEEVVKLIEQEKTKAAQKIRRAENAARRRAEKEQRQKDKDLARLEELQAKYKEDLKNGKS